MLANCPLLQCQQYQTGRCKIPHLYPGDEAESADCAGFPLMAFRAGAGAAPVYCRRAGVSYEQLSRYSPESVFQRPHLPIVTAYFAGRRRFVPDGWRHKYFLLAEGSAAMRGYPAPRASFPSGRPIQPEPFRSGLVPGRMAIDGLRRFRKP
ncbi:hypothetical protein KCP77_12780 [Salmonella enterica subsp. enterica]|nr:hypothetical protein KCP77_12780 [Salmonella enterica subsp. enterica]